MPDSIFTDPEDLPDVPELSPLRFGQKMPMPPKTNAAPERSFESEGAGTPIAQHLGAFNVRESAASHPLLDFAAQGIFRDADNDDAAPTTQPAAETSPAEMIADATPQVNRNEAVTDMSEREPFTLSLPIIPQEQVASNPATDDEPAPLEALRMALSEAQAEVSSTLAAAFLDEASQPAAAAIPAVPQPVAPLAAKTNRPAKPVPPNAKPSAKALARAEHRAAARHARHEAKQLRARRRLTPDTLERAQGRALRVGRVAVGVLTLLLLALLGRVYQLQHSPPARVAALIDSQVSTRELAARRGGLVDRRDRPLATTRVAHLLFVDPEIVEDPNTFSEHVGYSLDYDPAWVEMTLAKRRGSRYIVLDPRMTDERFAAYQKLPPLRGLSSESILVREYPQGRAAGQLVGFMGTDGKGLDGLEKAFDERLRPDPGQHAFVYDRGRNRLWLANQDYKLQADAKPIRLSLDLNLQAIAEQELAATLEAFNAESGQVLVMDPHTGEILALANYPFFSPADFLTADKGHQRNRVVTDVFEPGSIMKPFVWAAALEAGLTRPDEMFDTTTVGWWKPARGPVLRDASPHGVISWDDVLKYSSNIGLAMVAERMGKAMLHRVVTSYGFGQSTGSGLPGELAGILRPHTEWSFADLTRIPMGQGIAVTPLQITRAFCALANDGVLINPTIEARDEQTPQQRRTNITARVLSPRVTQHTREVLGRVITEGTGRKARSKLYDLFGKTGTAQLPDFENGGYFQHKYVSSFVAGAPLDKPRIVVGMFIHNPDRSIGHYGGTVCGPAIQRIIDRSLLYLGVPPKPQPSSEPQPSVARR